MTKESKDGGTDEKRGWKGKLEEGNKKKKNMTKMKEKEPEIWNWKNHWVVAKCYGKGKDMST